MSFLLLLLLLQMNMLHYYVDEQEKAMFLPRSASPRGAYMWAVQGSVICERKEQV